MTDDLNKRVAEALDARRGSICEAVVARQYELWPGLAARYGERGRARCLEDAGYHLSYLSQSIASAAPSLFSNYVAWARVMLAGRGIPAEDLASNLKCILDGVREALPEDMSELACRYVEASLSQLPQLPDELPSYIDGGGLFAELARLYLDTLLAGDRHAASRLIMDAVSSGVGVKQIYLHVFQRSQYEIGRLWQMNRLTVAQEHYCTAATQLIMSQLYPRIFSTYKNGRTLVATCVGGDLHEIGVRMVSDFFELEGWDTYYLGANTPAEAVVRAVADRRADVLAVSVTITSRASAAAEMIAAIRASDPAGRVKVLAGGYPFNLAPDLWKQVGADAWAADAEQAIAVANRLMGDGGAR
jgi:methanogenic corrinoid protein MtbC1